MTALTLTVRKMTKIGSGGWMIASQHLQEQIQTTDVADWGIWTTYGDRRSLVVVERQDGTRWVLFQKDNAANGPFVRRVIRAIDSMGRPKGRLDNWSWLSLRPAVWRFKNEIGVGLMPLYRVERQRTRWALRSEGEHGLVFRTAESQKEARDEGLACARQVRDLYQSVSSRVRAQVGSADHRAHMQQVGAELLYYNFHGVKIGVAQHGSDWAVVDVGYAPNGRRVLYVNDAPYKTAEDALKQARVAAEDRGVFMVGQITVSEERGDCWSLLDTPLEAREPGPDSTLEILVNGHWVAVTEWVWRSWGGQRRLDGQEAVGLPVYYLGSDEIVSPSA